MFAPIHKSVVIRVGFVIVVNALIGYLLDDLLGFLALNYGLYPNTIIIRFIVVIFSLATSFWAFLPRFPINMEKKSSLGFIRCYFCCTDKYQCFLNCNPKKLNIETSELFLTPIFQVVCREKYVMPVYEGCATFTCFDFKQADNYRAC
jgi:hypothetical protein